MTSEAQGKQNCTEILNEEEACLSDTLSTTELMGTIFCRKSFKTSKNRKTPGTEGIKMKLNKYFNRKLKSRRIEPKECYM